MNNTTTWSAVLLDGNGWVVDISNGWSTAEHARATSDYMLAERRRQGDTRALGRLEAPGSYATAPDGKLVRI